MLHADLRFAQRLARASARSLAQFTKTCREVYPDIDATVLRAGGGIAVYGGDHCPINRAFDLGLNGPVSAAELDQIEAFYAERGLPAAVDVCPLADSSLLALLSSRGYRLDLDIDNELVRPLKPADVLLPPAPQGLTVERVPLAELAHWSLIVSRGFRDQEDAPPAAYSYSLVAAHKPDVTAYLARVDGQPAGGAALEIVDDIAMCFSGSTLPSFRRRGVQLALLHARLRDAVAAGCTLVTAGAAPGSNSQRNMERAGFQVAYTRLVLVRDLA